MLRTTYLNLKKPEGSDPVNVQDFNDNADTIDTEVNARVKSSGGDIANTKVSAFTASTASYPVPAAGETPKVFMGKIKKFFEDFKAFKDSIVTKTMIINQILNDSTKAASAATVYSVNEKVDSAISDLGGLAAKIEVQQKNNIDICTLSTGLYYCVNCKNMPPQWVGCYLQVMRLDSNWCYMIAYEPYNGTNAIATTKCYEGTWSGWIQRAQ